MPLPPRGSSPVARALLLLSVLGWIPGCGAGAGATEPAPSAAADPAWFVDEAPAAGLTARHVNGMSGTFLFPEVMGPGIALFDYDNDGDLDVFAIGGGPLAPGAHRGDGAGTPGADRLFRNDLEIAPDGRRRLRFEDVTAASGIPSLGYGMGVAAGDVDNDGCVDLYVTRYGRNSLFRNRCDGTFVDATAVSGVSHEGWSVSAAFADLNRDGWLDLYVTDYVTYRLDAHVDCVTPSGKPDYCSPSAFTARPGRLFLNNGDGTLTDVTHRSKVGSAFGPGLGVVSADFNRDGWLDLYVANDGQENQLWINQHDGTFVNTALLAGVALNGAGRPEASMGVDAADVDGDGDEDLLITNLTGEGHTLYLNDGTAVFEDAGSRSGLRPASLPYTGFGTALVDLDNDGRLDVLAVNGAVRVIEALEQAGDPYPLRQVRQLFLNTGQARFTEAGSRIGGDFAAPDVGRGAAFGDVDNDGDTDVVVANNNGPVRLLINTRGNRHAWMGLRLVGRRAPRDQVGAVVAVTRNDGSVFWRRSRADGSYASANDPRVLVGLGTGTATSVKVRWPSGHEEEWSAPPAGRYTTLTEGSAHETR